MIRKATSDDLDRPDFSELIREFRDESGRYSAADPKDHLIPHWKLMLGMGAGMVLLWEEDGVIAGALGALVVADPFDGSLVCAENFWFVSKKFRGGTGAIRLFDEFEKQAEAAGCKRCLMVHLHNLTPDKLERLYTRRGFRLIEKTYEKDLWVSSPQSH